MSISICDHVEGENGGVRFCKGIQWTEETSLCNDQLNPTGGSGYQLTGCSSGVGLIGVVCMNTVISWLY